MIETVTVVEAPDAKLPLFEDSVTQLCVLDTFQLIELPPVFCNVKAWLDGLKGPPWVPEAFSPPTGVIERDPGVEIVRLRLALTPDENVAV